MKICYLADAQSIHTQRWVRSVSAEGHEVIVITFRPSIIKGVTVHTLKSPYNDLISPTTHVWDRLHYVFNRKQVKLILDSFAPDILHAFWATSYGFLGSRMQHPNFLVSVWGQDITKSPNKYFIMKIIVKYVLKKAKYIFCTSEYLANETKKYINDNNKIIKIPFGVERYFFSKKKIYNKNITIGSTKSLEKYYGGDILIKAFAIIIKEFPDVKLKLVGDGTYKYKLVELINSLQIEDKSTIIPAVNHLDIPSILSTIDIFVMPSIVAESFGVSALEASAMGLPVVASNLGGIPEVVINKVTGILVDPNSVDSLVNALSELIKSRYLCEKYGDAGRIFVKENYRWNNNVQMQIRKYKKLVN